VKRALLVLAACHSAAKPAAHDDAPGAIADATADASTCGQRAGARGLTHRTMMLGGLQRTYSVYLPLGVAPTAPAPLVFVFHGYSMSGQEMYDVTDWTSIADGNGVALAFPDGESGPNSLNAPWNVGSNVCPAAASVAPPNATGDDLAFVDAMRADIAADQCVDAAHTFVTGFSMGGYFSHHVGCERADIRGVAPHSGGTHALDACPVAKKPVIIFHGLSDPIVPPGCDDPTQNTPSGYTASAPAWAAHNGCAATFTTTPVQGGRCIKYDGCPPGGQVELCTFDGMGHCWAGGFGSSIFACNNYASATVLTWDFFQQYAW
jgi:polyhydroxybutyrate depolymerase